MRPPGISTRITPLLLLLVLAPVTSYAACYTIYGRNHAQTTKDLCPDFSYTFRLDVYNGNDLLNLVPLKQDSIKLSCKVGKGMGSEKLLTLTNEAINESTGSDELDTTNDPYKSFQVCGNNIKAGEEYIAKVSIRPETYASYDDLPPQYINYYRIIPKTLTCEIQGTGDTIECRSGAP